jgi:hypothetical protein
MPDENNDSNNTNENSGNNNTDASSIKIENNESSNESNNSSSNDNKELSIEEKVQQEVDKALKPIKENLDKAYAARDDALAQVKVFEEEKRKAEIERLEEEGKHKEAYEASLADERAKNAELNKRNIELTRDIDVRNELAKYELRNQSAQELVFKEIVANLTQDANGKWVHKNGTSIEDSVKSYLEDASNSFLLKAKTNQGSGQDNNLNDNASASASGSLFEKSQAEVLELAAQGKLRQR